MLYNKSFDSSKYKRKCTILSVFLNILTISAFVLTVLSVHKYIEAKLSAGSNMVFISGIVYLILASVSFYVHEYIINDADYVALLPLKKSTFTKKEKKVLISELSSKTIYNKIAHSFTAAPYFEYYTNIKFISIARIKAIIYKSLHNIPNKTKLSDMINLKKTKPTEELKACISNLIDKIKNDVPLTDVDRFEINLLLIKEKHLNAMGIDIDVYAVGTSIQFNSPDREEQVRYLISSKNRAELSAKRTIAHKKYLAAKRLGKNNIQ